MKIYIEDLKFQCIIGILDFERTTKQNVIINVEIEYTFDKSFLDYAKVVNFIKTSMINNKFLLIEDALNDISHSLKKEFLAIDSLYLKITKPSILPDCTVSVSNFSNFNS